MFILFFTTYSNISFKLISLSIFLYINLKVLLSISFIPPYTKLIISTSDAFEIKRDIRKVFVSRHE